MARLKVIKSKQFFEEGTVEHLAQVPSGGNRPAVDWKKAKLIGKAVDRVDGYDKVSGTAEFTFDVHLPQMAHARILRSPHPHAQIKRIRTSRAEALPGVLAVITRENTPKTPWYGDTFIFNPHSRYIGDEVACVAAETEEIAEEALRLIEVDCEILPFVTDPVKAAEGAIPPFHEAGHLLYGKAEEYQRGDIDAGFAGADVMVEDSFTTQVAVHNTMEPHCSVVNWEGNKLKVWDSTQGIYHVRDQLAEFFKLPSSNVQVTTRYMGGGFGSKLRAGKHTVMAALLSRRIGRPVRIALDRREQNLSAGNRPDSIQRLKIGAKSDGTLTAMSFSALGSSGAYSASSRCFWPFMTMYKCENVSVEQRSAFTNLGKGAPFRAPGHPQGTFALDSILDELAEKIGIDPLDLRLKNYAEIDQVSGQPYTSKKLREAYKQGARRFGWRAKFRPPGSDKGPVKRGVGLASQIWWGGGGPPAGVTVKLNRDGSVSAIAGSQDLGTGTCTFIAQIVAEALEIPVQRVEVTLGKTAVGPYCPSSGGSVTAPSVAPAANDAAMQVRDTLIEGAAAILEAPKEKLVYRDGTISVGGDSGRRLTIGEVIGEMREQTIVRTGLRAANPEGYMIQTFGVQFAEVEVDTMTGKVRVIKIVAAHDVGRTLNRKLLENQFEGGIIMGISLALLEERIVDEYTGKVLTTNLHDYKLPTVLDTPEIETIVVDNHDTTANSLGVKGVGEPPIIPTAGAIANAVYNAIGVRIRSLPITPDKVLTALQA